MTAGIQRSDRVVARELRTENEVKASLLTEAKQTRRNPKSVTANAIPPFCYRLPGMSIEEGAAAAVKALHITYACDALAFLWKMRRDAQGAQTGAGECLCFGDPNKTQQQAITQAVH